MKMKVEAPKEIEDGRHWGTIKAIEYRDNPYAYTELIIEVENSGMKVKAGYPTYLSPVSKLGKLLERFGFNLEVGTEIEPEALIGKECSYVVVNRTTPQGKFPTVVVESVVPRKE